MEYQEFIKSKAPNDVPTGLVDIPELNPMLFDFQKDIVRWALRRGRAAIFADCGLGKTPMQLEWARIIPGKVLILCPLAVSAQTVREGEKFNIPVQIAHDQGEATGKINVTNYEKLDHFDPGEFDGIVLDESSILKNYAGKIRTKVIEEFQSTPYRLACTATPAPNDHMELGNHAEFIGAMTRQEMLAMFFIHDGGETQKWRLKGHARGLFWEWICSWAVMLRKPSDLGYEDDGFILPGLHIHQQTVESPKAEDTLFAIEAKSLQERIAARRASTSLRVQKCAELINGDSDPWLIWCNMNNESASLKGLIDDCIEVKGSDSSEFKERAMLDFSAGKIKRLVTKPSIAGYGMNWQHCHKIAFVGLSDSYEQFYQAIRRCWRFGQDHEVDCHIITASAEGAVVRNIKRKEKEAAELADGMVANMHELNESNIKGTTRSESIYKTSHTRGAHWEMFLGDAVEVCSDMDDESIHYSIFSPPFASLYTYSNSDRDMGNCKDNSMFLDHFRYLVEHLYRVIMPGRLVSFHCMNLPSVKVRDGYIGIKDFRGDLIRIFQDAGFIYASEVVIWKDPVTAMQRTKAKGLLHKQIVKDSTECRQGIPDYLVTMKKPGENPEPVAGELDHFAGDPSTFQPTGRLSIDIWQKYASPIWTDINQSNTLQHRSARHEDDERHICPLQLDVIHRGLQLWTNPHDLVLSPFAGIGSEGWEAIKMERRFVGVELKDSYYNQAIGNLRRAERETGELFV